MSLPFYWGLGPFEQQENYPSPKPTCRALARSRPPRWDKLHPAYCCEEFGRSCAEPTKAWRSAVASITSLMS